MSDSRIIFPETLQKLIITTCINSLDDLPSNITELEVHSVSFPVTNLPFSLKRIIVMYMHTDDIIKTFTKLPYGCTVENPDGDIILK
ncbi:MAG: hypothetical protein Gaeavirus14_12 [Gaeavirus sp.]|uniref:Uncharacterized protein n=1 Tax=Gaeavirus sp. TaxID=2487767 RepID=A0A3G4ZZ73_9VIRU|nr:MAG: hypothetical protein Gaeavirus14_12 [Gaeavirus sp.]